MADVVLYATDTMADWEYAYLVAGLAWVDDGRFRLRVLGDGPATGDDQGSAAPRDRRRPRRRRRGRRRPARAARCRLLGLGPRGRSLALAARLLAREVPVAAICGATLGLARSGLLDERDHTSNAADFLLSSGYAGGARYRDAPVVEDRDVITAPATRPVDFAAAVFRRLEVFPGPVVDAWYGLYTTGERRFFDQLVGPGAA